MSVLDRPRATTSITTTTTAAARKGARAGLLLAAVATVVWSGNFVVARALHDAVPPVQTAFWRWVIALLAVLPLAWPQLRAQWPALRRHAGYLTVASLLGIACFNTFIYQAGQSTSATNMAVIAAASPLLIVVFDRFTGRRIGGRRATGMLIALAGVLALVAKGSPAALLELDFATGDLWMLAAGATFAGYSVLLRRRPKEISGIVFLCATFAVGVLLLAPAYAISLSAQGGFAPTASTVGPLLYVGVFSSAIAYFTWNKAVALVGAARAGIVYYLQPLVVAVLSFALLGEGVTVVQVGCMAVIVGGVALAAKERKADR
ncbi:DMT family transporter [Streptomyces coryli]|uniref:DMT family transporter n=1 Tax=Streptomyces coryli TaxID=1128680 RepID=UPI0030B88500